MYADLRRGRHSRAQQIYHITTVTLGRYPFFTDLYRGRLLVRQLMQLQAEGIAHTLCFVVMPDHLHWLMVLHKGGLSDAVRTLKARTAQRSAARLWQPNFHDHALRNEEDLRVTARYIVANPIRAGLVSRIGDYPLWDAAWLREGKKVFS
jgi:REP element-mobilizing transposase RayT